MLEDLAYRAGIVLSRKKPVSQIKLSNLDRVLWIIGRHRICRDVRLQMYGFMLARWYRVDMARIGDINNVEFYHDWQPGYHGGYSKELESDIESCVQDGILHRLVIRVPGSRDISIYELAAPGRRRWDAMCNAMPVLKRFSGKVGRMQRTEYVILGAEICITWPEFNRRYVEQYATCGAEQLCP